MNEPKHKTWSGQDHSEFYPNLPKYQIGDRFTVMDTVNCQIIQIIKGRKETIYIFQLFDNPVFKSLITEKELDVVIANQKSA